MARGKQFLKERLHELLEGPTPCARAYRCSAGQSGLASVRASSQALVFWLAFVFFRLLVIASETTMPFRYRARAPRRLSNIASGRVMWSQGKNPSAWPPNGLFRSTDFSHVFVPQDRQSFVREFVATDRKRPLIRRGREGGRLLANTSATSSTNARQPQSRCARPARSFEEPLG